MWDWLINSIVGEVNEVFRLLTESIGELVALASKSPSQFNQNIWNAVISINERAVLPIAYLLLSIFLFTELIQLLRKTEAQGIESLRFFVIFIFKLLIGMMVLENIPYILDGIFSISAEIVRNANFTIATTPAVSGGVTDALEGQDIETLLSLWFTCMIVNVIQPLCQSLCGIVLKLRYVEIYVMSAVAALPLATVVSSSHEVSSIGYGFVKRICALSLQVVFIMIVFLFYGQLVTTEAVVISVNEVSTSIWEFLGYTILLVIALFQTGSWSKAIMGTH